MAKDKTTLNIDVNVNSGAANTKLKDVNNSLKKTGEQGQKAGQKINDGMVEANSGIILLTGAAVGLGIALKGAIQVAQDFEYSMAKVAAIGKVTGNDFKMLEAQALKLGETTSKTSMDVAELQLELAKIGFDPTQIANSTEGILNLSIAMDEGLAASAEVTGGVMSAFQISAENTNHVVNVMAKSFTGSAMNLERFRESMKTVAPIANAASVSIEETSAMMMVLANNSIHGSLAGTGLKNILSKMHDPTSKLNILFGNQVKTFPQLVAKLKELKAGNFDLAEASKYLDARSKAAFLALVNGADDLEQFQGELADTTDVLEEMRAKMEDTLEGATRKLESAIQGLSIKIGKSGLGGALKTSKEALADWITGIDTEEIYAYTAGLTVATIGVGALAASVHGLKWATIQATMAFKAMRVAMMATGWGALAVGVGSAVGALLDWFNVWGDNEDTIDKGADGVGKVNARLDEHLRKIQTIQETTDIDTLVGQKEKLEKRIDTNTKIIDSYKESVNEAAWDTYYNDEKVERQRMLLLNMSGNKRYNRIHNFIKRNNITSMEEAMKSEKFQNLLLEASDTKVEKAVRRKVGNQIWAFENAEQLTEKEVALEHAKASIFNMGSRDRKRLWFDENNARFETQHGNKKIFEENLQMQKDELAKIDIKIASLENVGVTSQATDEEIKKSKEALEAFETAYRRRDNDGRKNQMLDKVDKLTTEKDKLIEHLGNMELDETQHAEKKLEIETWFQTEKQKLIDGYTTSEAERKATEEERDKQKADRELERLQRYNDMVNNVRGQTWESFVAQTDAEAELMKKAGVDSVKIEAWKNQKKFDFGVATAQSAAGTLASSAAMAAKGGVISAKQAQQLAQFQAGVDAIASANAAYKAMAGIPVVGPALGVTAAGLALAAGVANVKSIKSAQFKPPETKKEELKVKPPKLDVFGANKGGWVSSELGSGDRDDVPAMLTAGEYVIRKGVVDALGIGFFDGINGMAMGGLVSYNPIGSDVIGTTSLGSAGSSWASALDVPLMSPTDYSGYASGGKVKRYYYGQGGSTPPPIYASPSLTSAGVSAEAPPSQSINIGSVITSEQYYRDVLKPIMDETEELDL